MASGLDAPLRGRPAPVRTMEAIACARSCASGTSRLGGRQRHRRRARRGSRAGRRGALRGSNAACGGWEVELYRGGAAPSLEPVEQLEIGSVRAFWALPLPRGDRSCASIRIVDCFERCRRLLAENILLSALCKLWIRHEPLPCPGNWNAHARPHTGEPSGGMARHPCVWSTGDDQWDNR